MSWGKTHRKILSGSTVVQQTFRQWLENSEELYDLWRKHLKEESKRNTFENYMGDMERRLLRES